MEALFNGKISVAGVKKVVIPAKAGTTT